MGISGASLKKGVITMGHRHFDASGTRYRIYAADSDKGEGYNISRAVAGDVVDIAAKFFMQQTKEADYSKAVHAVLEKDPALKAAYVGI